MSNVLLLRAPSKDPDRYESTFDLHGYKATSIPVLETIHINIDALGKIICDGSDTLGYGGVIITSQRASYSWKLAMDYIAERLGVNESLSSRPCMGPTKFSEGWASIPFYVVGQATAVTIRNACEGVGYKSIDIRGELTGTAEQLSHFINNDLADKSRPLLYLTGDKNREILSNTLKENGFKLHPLQVYKTQGLSDFEERLSEVVFSNTPWWIVYFAPSAADFVTPIVKKRFDLPSLPSNRTCVRIAAIGPTTGEFLRDKLNMLVDVVAPNPTPENLVACIVAHDAEEIK